MKEKSNTRGLCDVKSIVCVDDKIRGQIVILKQW